MMTLERFTCSDCGTDIPAGPSPHHWNAFVAAHLFCDSAPQHPLTGTQQPARVTTTLTLGVLEDNRLVVRLVVVFGSSVLLLIISAIVSLVLR